VLVVAVTNLGMVVPAAPAYVGVYLERVKSPSGSRGAPQTPRFSAMEWLRLLLGAVRALRRGRRDLVLENLLRRQQRAVLLRTRPHPRLRRRDKAFWLVARHRCRDWRRHLVLVQPETVIRWHRQGGRRFWWWRSGRPTGRPRLSEEVRDLITRLSRENPLWGTARIRGERLKLGVVVSAGSSRRYRWRRPPRPPGRTRRTFRRTHAAQIWAADRFTVPTLTFQTLDVRFFIGHDRRELLHIHVTAPPPPRGSGGNSSTRPPGAANQRTSFVTGTGSMAPTSCGGRRRWWVSRYCSPLSGRRAPMPSPNGWCAPFGTSAWTTSSS
jgi:hypothetical protein